MGQYLFSIGDQCCVGCLAAFNLRNREPRRVRDGKNGQAGGSTSKLWAEDALRRADRSPGELRSRRLSSSPHFALEEDILSRRKTPFMDEYTIHEKPMGTGAFGNVYGVTQKSTGLKFACKELMLRVGPRSSRTSAASTTTNSKNEGVESSTGCPRKLKCADKKRVLTEVEVMKNLDHPNIVSLYEIYETPTKFYLVMEVCTGGELFDQISAHRSFSEPLAVSLMTQVMRPVHYMHCKRIMHRDLKPENYMFQRPGPLETSTLKLIDFGISQPFLLGPGNATRRSMVGTSFYMAPQVLMGIYDEKVDVWSIGVIMYIMLTGTPPFDGRNMKEIISKIRLGRVQYHREWKNISKQAQDLCQKLLTFEPASRIDMKQALNHDWLKKKENSSATASTPLPETLVKRLEHFQNSGKFKRACMLIIAGRSLNTDDDDIRRLHDLFQEWDTNNDGVLSLQELKIGMERGGYFSDPNNANVDFEKVFENMDVRGTGVIDYTEFLAATLDERQFLRKDKMMTAFHMFDSNGDGKITLDELQAVLMKQNIKASDVFEELDANNDGIVEFAEFEAMIVRVLDQISDGTSNIRNHKVIPEVIDEGEEGEDCSPVRSEGDGSGVRSLSSTDLQTTNH